MASSPEFAFASQCQNLKRRAWRWRMLSQQSALRQCTLSLSLASYTSLTLKKVPFENWTGLARPLAHSRARAWVGIEDVPRKMPKSLGVSDRFWWPARESSRELHWAQSFILRWRSSTGSLFSLSPRSISLSLSLSICAEWEVTWTSRYEYIGTTKLCALLAGVARL